MTYTSGPIFLRGKSVFLIHTIVTVVDCDSACCVPALTFIILSCVGI